MQDDGGRGGESLALAAVPASQRTALVLCYLDGFTAAEVGGELEEHRSRPLAARARPGGFKRAYAGVEL